MEITISQKQPLAPLVVILAGGKGRRMGGNKPLYPLEGGSLIGKVLERLQSQGVEIKINAGEPTGELAERLSKLAPTLFDVDNYVGLGPMSGVYTGLQYAKDVGENEVITVPCDMPALPADYVQCLRGASTHDCDVVHFKGERDYPLCAIWNIRQLPHLLRTLEASRPDGGLGVMKYLATVRVQHVPVANDRDFLNVNTVEDLASLPFLRTVTGNH
ncbi:MAG: hypothetical protein B7Z26_00065 [Asticcacaulis sp. 32-58-5]|nr:MAG: hypothetical protein B7Z26_00065 [Asticcacaulis sp. 32-58-5]